MADEIKWIKLSTGILDDEKINRYRSFFGDSPYTIFREEESEADQQSEMVISELKAIDRCFADDDADGINEIMKKAEENTELSNSNKLRIISECRSALLELKVINSEIHSTNIN